MLTNYKIELKFANIVQICVFIFGIITLLRLSYLHLCNRVRYVCFPHNLSILANITLYHLISVRYVCFSHNLSILANITLYHLISVRYVCFSHNLSILANITLYHLISVRYVCFSHNLSILAKHNPISSNKCQICMLFS